MLRKVIYGNSTEKLKLLPDESIDAVVTDAPYGLGKEPDAMLVLKDWIEKGYHEVGSPKKGRKHCSGYILHDAIVRNSNGNNTKTPENSIPFSISISLSVVRSMAIQFYDKASSRKVEIGNKCRSVRLKNMLVDEWDTECNKSVRNKQFSLGVRQTFSGCISICSCFNKVGDSLFSVNVRLYDDSFRDAQSSSNIVTIRRAEVYAILTLDVRNGSGTLQATDSTINDDTVFEISCPELIRAFSTARSLPPMKNTSLVGTISDTTDRTISIDILTHKSVIERLKGAKKVNLSLSK